MSIWLNYSLVDQWLSDKKTDGAISNLSNVPTNAINPQTTQIVSVTKVKDQFGR